MSKRGKEKSRGKDARDIEDVRRKREREVQRDRNGRREEKDIGKERKRETANKRSRICVEMRGSEGGGVNENARRENERG